ncbi:hypothetical protein RHS01_00704 [Rhizoctonia solani]|uniref:Large ribosomal subunit protein mL59 domain-containing protein n=1 Tax=Rhizoctonia solani TaxID=456999 RepID=A0A8H7IK78_9AGAM|nr:hypothetical protein RHS01_00704 [Rhizoctonia solani]
MPAKHNRQIRGSGPQPIPSSEKFSNWPLARSPVFVASTKRTREAGPCRWGHRITTPGVKARREDGAGERSDVASASSGLPALNWEGEPAPKSTVGIRSTQRRFKGHKWEREAKERAEFVAKRMETMAKRIAEAKAAKIQERTKARPSLPF